MLAYNQLLKNVFLDLFLESIHKPHSREADQEEEGEGASVDAGVELGADEDVGTGVGEV